MPDFDIDLLVIIIVSRSQSQKLMGNLNKRHYFFTIIDSSSSLFQEPTVCLLLGLNHRRLEDLNKLVHKYCKPYKRFVPVEMRAVTEFSHLPVLESQEGGATLYGLPVESFEQI